jgi:hypothetical protein
LEVVGDVMEKSLSVTLMLGIVGVLMFGGCVRRLSFSGTSGGPSLYLCRKGKRNMAIPVKRKDK